MSRQAVRSIGAALLVCLSAAATAQTTPGRPGARSGLSIEPVRGIYGYLLEGPFIEPAGVYFDHHQSEIFVCDGGGRRIAIADDRGFPNFSFGSSRSLRSPRAVVVDRDGKILVADTGHPGVRVFDYDGQILPDLDLSAAPPAERPLRPSALALDPDGSLFILDSANRRVLVVDLLPCVESPLPVSPKLPTDLRCRTPKATAVRAFGAPEGAADLFRSPVDLDLTPEGDLVLADASGLAVQVYDRSGRFLRGWGGHDVGLSEFSLPAGVAVDAEGRIFAADTLRHDVKVFSAEGRFLTNFGGWGTRPGQLLYPVDVASASGGRILVAERGGRRIQVFRVGSADAKARRTQPG